MVLIVGLINYFSVFGLPTTDCHGPCVENIVCECADDDTITGWTSSREISITFSGFTNSSSPHLCCQYGFLNTTFIAQFGYPDQVFGDCASENSAVSATVDDMICGFDTLDDVGVSVDMQCECLSVSIKFGGTVEVQFLTSDNADVLKVVQGGTLTLTSSAPFSDVFGAGCTTSTVTAVIKLVL